MRYSLFAAALAVILWRRRQPLHAAEITVLSGNGAQVAVAELAAQFERATGHKVTIRFEVNPQAQRRIEAGEACDVAILNPPVLDELIKQGKIVAGTRVVLGRSGIGVGSRKERPCLISPLSLRSRARCSTPVRWPIREKAPAASTS